MSNEPVRICFSLLALLELATGCGGSTQLPPTRSAAGELTKVVYWVARDSIPDDTGMPRTRALTYKEGLDFADALEAQLLKLGFQVSKYALVGGDVEITLEVVGADAMDARFPIDDNEGAVLVSAWVAGRCIDSAWIVFDPESPVPAEDLERIASMVTASRVVDPALRKIAERERAAAQVRVEQRDHAAWEAAGSERCVQPATIDACDAVYAYLTLFSNGLHVQQARQVIEQGRKARDKLAKEDRYWQAADPDACRASGAEACDMVQAYLLIFQRGRYEREAREALASQGIAPPS